MATFWFIRHGQSEAQLRPELINGRSAQVPLTKKGVKQARVLGDCLARESSLPYFDFVWYSPALRTVDTKENTIEVFSACRNIVPMYGMDDHRLFELDQGDWTGANRHEVYTKYMLGMIKKDPLNFKAPNGESQREVAERMDNWLTEALRVAEKYIPNWVNPHAEPGLTACNIAVFGHGLAFKCFLCNHFGIDNLRAFDIVIDNCSITKVEIFKDQESLRCKLLYLNFVYPEIRNVRD